MLSVLWLFRDAYLLKKVGNPYCFRAGELWAKLEFMKNVPRLQTALADFFNERKAAFSFMF